MKKVLAGFAFVSLLAFTGCGGPSQSSGGNPEKPKETVTLSTENVTLKQGETKELKITAKKGAEFKDAIPLTFTVDKPDAGVAVEAEKGAKAEIAADKTDIMVKVSATDKAPPGEYVVTLTGKTTPKDAETKFKVKVEEKK
jgi:uncharacterized membrane protein